MPAPCVSVILMQAAAPPAASATELPNPDASPDETEAKDEPEDSKAKSTKRRNAAGGEPGSRPRKRTRSKLPPPPTNHQSTKRRHWTEAEDKALRDAMAEIVPHRWKLIAQRVPGRDHIQCLQRWQKVLDPSLVKGFWTEEEDRIVIEMKRRGCNSWVEMARAVKGRNPKQVCVLNELRLPQLPSSFFYLLPRRPAHITHASIIYLHTACLSLRASVCWSSVASGGTTTLIPR